MQPIRCPGSALPTKTLGTALILALCSLTAPAGVKSVGPALKAEMPVAEAVAAIEEGAEATGILPVATTPTRYDCFEAAGPASGPVTRTHALPSMNEVWSPLNFIAA